MPKLLPGLRDFRELNPGHPSVLFAEVVTQMGIEPMTTRCLVVALATKAPSTVRPLARDPRVLIGWPFPLGFGLDGRLLLARRGRVYVYV